MIGQRPIDFYKKINKLHNVKIVKPNFYQDPKPWIEKSECVVTISGTSAFEAAMLNKPAIVFGNSFYNLISSIKIINSYDDFETLFKNIQNNELKNDNIRDCAIYLKTIKELGMALDIKSLIELSNKKILFGNLKLDEEKKFHQFLIDFKMFYEKSINIFNFKI